MSGPPIIFIRSSIGSKIHVVGVANEDDDASCVED
jgi:hypothetical protein